MKKISSLMLAVAATLMFTTTSFAHGHNVGFGVFHNGFGYAGFSRTFAFSAPVYSTVSAYYYPAPVTLVQQPPVVTLAADPCPTTVAAPAQVVETLPAPTVAYTAAPAYSYNFFGVSPGYAVNSYGTNLGVRRFEVNRVVERRGRTVDVRIERHRRR